jgi:hypothetical protein
MNAPGPPPTVTIWRPWAILVVALLFISPLVVLLFLPRWRFTGTILLVMILIGIAKQPISVRITDSDVSIRSFLGTTHYPLKNIKDVVWVSGTSTAVRLELFDAQPVQISGFLIDGTDQIYKAISGACARLHASQQT